MGFFQIIGWLLFGLIVGAIARFLLPGKQEMNLLVTIALGVAGSFVGGAISWLIFGGSSYVQAAGWIMSIVGAFLLVLIYSRLMDARKKKL
jgi:uncharacterized membrane protein YeaQ/YmgE (transglycosylase-associated protein family)